MGFKFDSFVGGFADGATAQYKAQDKEKKDAISSKRSLIFNATTDMYTQARLAKKETDEQVKKDKKYLSAILSMDPYASKDNQKKLLSLSPERRLQAESELTWRRTDDPEAGFNSFMSYVDKPENLDNTVGLDAAYQNSLTVPPKAAVAYYDKSGLITDSEVRTIYGEVASVMTEVYGYSPAQARAISTQATNDLQYPPIRIDWSETIQLKDDQKRDAALILAGRTVNNKKIVQELVNQNIETTQGAITALESMFASTYSTPKITKEGEAVLDDDNNPVMHRPGAMFAVTLPNFGVDFRNSAEFNKLAVQSMTPFIIAMKINPVASEKSSMDYLNATFPGKYGGTLNLSEGTKEEQDKLVASANPSKVYYVAGGFTVDGAEKGYVFLGAQLQAHPAFKQASGGKKDNGGPVIPVVTTDETEAAEAVQAAKEALEYGEELGEDSATITLLENKVVESETALTEVTKKAASAAFLDERFKNWEFSVKPTADQHGPTSVRLKAAMKAEDPVAIEMELANLEKLSAAQDLSFQMKKKVGALRGDALRKLKAIDKEVNPTVEQLMQRLENFVQERPRSATMESLSGGIMGRKLKPEDIKEWLKQLKDADAPTGEYELKRYNRLKASLYELLQGN